MTDISPLLPVLMPELLGCMGNLPVVEQAVRKCACVLHVVPGISPLLPVLMPELLRCMGNLPVVEQAAHACTLGVPCCARACGYVGICGCMWVCM